MERATSTAAWIEVAQARITVCVSMRRGRPDSSTSSRAMEEAVIDGTTWPKTSSSICSGIEVVPLHQLLDDDAAQIERGEIVEDGVRLHERGPKTSDDRYATVARGHEASSSDRAKRPKGIGPADSRVNED